MHKKNELSLLAIISLMSLMGFVSLDIIFPSLPSMTKIFSVHISIIQLSISFYLLGYGGSQIFYGPLSDYYGRKPIVIIGILIYLLGGAICLFSININVLIFGRLIQGAGVGACALLSRVILRDCFEGARMAKNTSYVSAIIISGLSLAPVIGGVIQNFYGYKGVFLFMILYGAVSLYVIYRKLPETNNKKKLDLKLKYILNSYKNILKTRGFLSYTSLTSIALAVIIMYSSYNPFFIQDNLGYSPAYYGMMITIISLGEFVGASVNSRFVERCGINKMINIGFIFIGAASAMLIVLNFNTITLIGILLPSVFMAIGTGFIFANAISAAYSKFNEDIGAVGSVFGFLQIILTLIISYVVSIFELISPNFLAIVLILICFFGVIILRLTCKDTNLIEKVEAY